MYSLNVFFFFNDTATTEIYTLSLHDALPISPAASRAAGRRRTARGASVPGAAGAPGRRSSCKVPLACAPRSALRSEEHTSELQSRQYLVCRLLLEKKKQTSYTS